MISIFTETFQGVLDKHVPLKSRKIRGNQSPFVTKAVMNKPKTRKRH